MAFSREEMDDYEKQPAKVVSDKESPFKPAAAGDQQTPTDDQSTTDDDTTPSGDVDETPPDDSGDGTSDANDATVDSSTTDDAGPADDSDQSTTDADGNTVETPPKKGSARERIQEVIGERDSFRAYGEYAQEQIRLRDQQLAARDQELAELNKRLQGAKPAASGGNAPEVNDPIPTLDDPDVAYDTDKLALKLVKWRDTVMEKARKASASAPTTQPDPQAEGKKIVDLFTARVAAFTATHPDFEETVKLLPQLAKGPARTVVVGEDGPAILHWLGKHRADAVRIARLPEDEQMMEIGAIRADIRSKKPTQGKKEVIPPAGKTSATPDASKTQAKPKSQSNAPPPPTAVRGGARHDQVAITDPSLSMNDFVARDRAAKLAKREASSRFRKSR